MAHRQKNHDHAGPLAAHVQAIEPWLIAELGYTAAGAKGYGRLVADLGRWLETHGLDPSDVTDALLGRFAAHRRHSGARHWFTLPSLRSLVAYLDAVGAIAPRGERQEPLDEVGAVLAAYLTHLQVERRLAPLTVTHTGEVVGHFLRWLVAQGPLDLEGLDPGTVARFVTAEAARLSVGATRTVVHRLRPFLRYLFVTAVTATDLSECTTSIRGPRVAALPRALDDATVEALLEHCDRTRPGGRRDYAILLLLVRLGLRACEVAAMRLGDVDWRAGELTVHGKGGRLDALPLPADVGEALVDYLCNGRPSTTCDAVFMRALAPTGPMSRNAVVFVSRTVSQRAGVAVVGAHRLRHTAATEMLRAGCTLAEVGQVLRHNDEATTAIYASVDRAALSGVARLWPGVTR